MYEYLAQQGDYAPYGYNDLIEIRDFHTDMLHTVTTISLKSTIFIQKLNMAIACFRWLVGLSALMAVVHSQTPYGKDNSVCTSFTQPAGITNNVAKPNITNQFHCLVEIVIKNTNTTELAHEYFDSVNNRGFVEQTDESLRFDAWYDYSTNEFIGFFPDAPASTPGRCYVQDLSTSDQRFLFGYDNSQGKGHIFSAAGALHFGGQGVEEIYMGRTVVRDIQVDWWTSCQYWASMDATMIVDWYFTAQGSWDSAVGIRIPVTAHVQGISFQNGKHNFDHYYNFFDFRPYLDANEDTVFETPAGVQCPGRKLTRGFPSVPNDAFSFTTEILDTVNLQISFMTETFYYSQKLVMYEYRAQQGDYAPYGYNDLIEIHDFHTGVAYITDRAQGNCSFRPIESGDFDDKSSGPNTVRIRSSNEFFYFDVKNVSYEGIKQNRDIDCDTWVAIRSDYPSKFPVNSTWEWYFATTEWTEVNAGPESGNIPVQMRIAFPDQNQNYQYNIYNFKKSKPDLLKFDISRCYQFGQRRKFQFSLNVPDSVKAKISTNKEVFKYYVLQAVIAATGVSPIRVANLRVFIADAVIVTFALLDIAPNIGDVMKSPTYKAETPLDFAANTIASMIQNGQFVVTLGGDAFMNINPLVAQASGIVEITHMNVTTTVQNQQQTSYGPETVSATHVYSTNSSSSFDATWFSDTSVSTTAKTKTVSATHVYSTNSSSSFDATWFSDTSVSTTTKTTQSGMNQQLIYIFVPVSIVVVVAAVLIAFIIIKRKRNTMSKNGAEVNRTVQVHRRAVQNCRSDQNGEYEMPARSYEHFNSALMIGDTYSKLEMIASTNDISAKEERIYQNTCTNSVPTNVQDGCGENSVDARSYMNT